MKEGKCFTFMVIMVFFGLLFAACDNGTDPDTTQGSDPNTTQGTDPNTTQEPDPNTPPEPAPQTEIWSVIKNVADIAGVWEGSSQIEVLGDGDILPSSGLISFSATLMNEKPESKVDMVLRMDFNTYLDGIIAINPDSGYTKDSLWTEYKKSLSGSGYNAGNYFVIASNYTYTFYMTETEDYLINTGKNKIKIIMTKHDFYLMGMNVASDVTLILDKTGLYPATLIVKGGEGIGAGEYIIAVKILTTTEDTQMTFLGIGQNNENFNNDGNDAVFSHASTNFGRGRSQTFKVPGGKYAVKISVYRGSFLGWLHCKSDSFTIENEGIGILTYDYLEYPSGETRAGLGLKLTDP